MSGNTEVLAPESSDPKSTKLEELKAKITNLIVQTPDDYRLICEYKLAGDEFLEGLGFELDPGIASAKRHLQLLERQKAKHADRATGIIKAAKEKMAEWNQKCRLLADEQTRKGNEELRIKAEREAAEKKRLADEKAEADKKEAERLAEVERKEKEAQAKKDQKAREEELEDARKRGVISKPEEKRLLKAAAEKLETDKANAKMEADRKKKQADEDAETLRKQADIDAAAIIANRPTMKVLPAKVTVAGIRSGGSWRWEWITPDNPEESAEELAQNADYHLLLPTKETMGNVDYFPRIGKMVRETKDIAKAQELGGGAIRVWFEDR